MLDELKAFAQTRIAWFLIGVVVANGDVPTALATLRAFVGV